MSATARTLSAIVALLAVSLSPAFGQSQESEEPRLESPSRRLDNRTLDLMRDVRHELATLPYYDVFDWLEAEVRPDGTVILKGAVIRPTTRTDAEARVKNLEGATKVVNEIRVLPLSPADDDLRIALYRAIFRGDSPLSKYSLGAVPSIHIIVENGRATLKGVVDSDMDKQLAYIAARQVPGLFDVRNELTVEQPTT